MTLAGQLRRTRREQKLSLSEVARRAEISKAYLSQLEHGESKQPSYGVLVRLSTALGRTVAELTGQPAIWDPTHVRSIPPSLRSFAERTRLPDADLKMLARIHYRGKRPKNSDDWAHIYETIKRTIR